MYLVSAIALFALPNLSDSFAETLLKFAIPIMLPVAHIGMVSQINVKVYSINSNV